MDDVLCNDGGDTSKLIGNELNEPIDLDDANRNPFRSKSRSVGLCQKPKNSKFESSNKVSVNFDFADTGIVYD